MCMGLSGCGYMLLTELGGGWRGGSALLVRGLPAAGSCGAAGAVTGGGTQPLLSHPSRFTARRAEPHSGWNSLSSGRFSLFSHIPSYFVLRSVGGHLAGTVPQPSDPV